MMLPILRYMLLFILFLLLFVLSCGPVTKLSEESAGPQHFLIRHHCNHKECCKTAPLLHEDHDDIDTRNFPSS